MSKPKAPEHLEATGKALWKSIAPKYVLRPDEFARLEAACRTADAIHMLEEAWRESGYTMTSHGSMGQEVIHPLIGELRTQRSALASLLVGLKLPDEAGDAPQANQQRDAANSKWATGKGRGA